jgi:ATP-dependent DNA helicase RecG
MKTRKIGANKNEFSRGSYRVSPEGQLLDQQSLRAVTGKTTDWNATGSLLLLGIEDSQSRPPADQHISSDLLDTVRRKLAERTVNVFVLPDVVTAPNGGQDIELRIPRAMAVAPTTDCRCFLRLADQIKPVTGDSRGIVSGRYAYAGRINQSLISTIVSTGRSIAVKQNPSNSRTHP